MKRRLVFPSLLPFLISVNFATAENEPAGPLDPPAVAPIPVPAPVAPPPGETADTTGKPKKKKRREVKETEGSVAPGRFEAETILKSQYHLNGQQLEVDPD